MKTIFLALVFLFPSLIGAQQKGVTPIGNQQSTINNQNTYAVVVGISDYQDEGIPDLRFADKDALAFAGFLQSPAGGSLDEDHLKVLVNEQATGAQFAKALDWLWEVAGENDRVIIYFSGHGDVEKKSITQPGYLLGWDAPSRVYMAGGAMNLRDLNDVVSTLSVQNKAKVILITDACRAGKLSGSGIGGSQATAANLAKQYANEIKILSCQPDEYSIEGEQWGDGRGAFSYHLLDGLYGMADRNGDASVNLMEIRGYLEEHVSMEVEPQSQLPMTVGNGREKLTDVFPELLEELREGKKGQMQLFTPTVSRGIEDEVLAMADTNLVEMYLAFQESLANKQFLEPANACADFYYEKLSREPQLEKLHSSMRRNYAAALQDDAQQVMNTMLKSGLTEFVLKNISVSTLYRNYPDYLDRASELLGEDHYMFQTLQARKHFFEGEIAKRSKDKRAFYHKALNKEPDMPHAMAALVRIFTAEQLDSAKYYFQEATTSVPNWVEPYFAFSLYYETRLKQMEKAEALLDIAEKIDSNSLVVWYQKASFYHRQGKYKAAEKWYLKTIEASTRDICFPCVTLNLAGVYVNVNQLEEAEKYYNKTIHLDSNFVKAYYGLGNLYKNMRRYQEAENCYEKAIQLDSNYIEVYVNLGLLYKNMRRYQEAETCYEKAIQLDSNFVKAHYNIGHLYKDARRYKEAETCYQKAIQLDSNYAKAYVALGHIFIQTQRYDESVRYSKKAIQLDSNDLFAITNLGIAYRDILLYEEAEKYFLKAIQLDSTNPNHHNSLGSLYLNMTQYEKAETPLKQAVDIDPANWMAYSNLGILYQNLQHWEKAAEMTQKAIDILPGDGGLYAELAYALSYTPSRMREVTAIFERAQRLSPDWPDTYFYWAQFILRSGGGSSESKSLAHDYLRKAYEKGIVKNGVLDLDDLKTRKDFEIIRSEPVWIELMKKYFPDEFKD